MLLLADRLLGIHRNAPHARFAGRTFQRWAAAPQPRRRRKVVYFHGCGTNYYEPDVGEMVVAVLEHNGYHVGFRRRMLRTAAAVERQLRGGACVRPAARGQSRPSTRDGWPIVANSTSCGLMLKQEAREILGVEDDDLKAVSEATYDLCEFLLLMHERGEPDRFPAPAADRPPTTLCQQRGPRDRQARARPARADPDLNVIELDADCCGSPARTG